jgi:hypothetical protein
MFGSLSENRFAFPSALPNVHHKGEADIRTLFEEEGPSPK